MLFKVLVLSVICLFSAICSALSATTSQTIQGTRPLATLLSTAEEANIQLSADGGITMLDALSKAVLTKGPSDYTAHIQPFITSTDYTYSDSDDDADSGTLVLGPETIIWERYDTATNHWVPFTETEYNQTFASSGFGAATLLKATVSLLGYPQSTFGDPRTGLGIAMKREFNLSFVDSLRHLEVNGAVFADNVYFPSYAFTNAEFKLVLHSGRPDYYDWESDNNSIATVSNGGVVTIVAKGQAIITATGKAGTIASSNPPIRYTINPNHWVYRGSQTNVVESALHCQLKDPTWRLLTRNEFTNTAGASGSPRRQMGNLYGEWGELQSFGWGRQLYWTIEQSSIADGGYNFTVGSDTGLVHGRPYLDDKISIACIADTQPQPDGIDKFRVNGAEFALNSGFPTFSFVGAKLNVTLQSNEVNKYNWYSSHAHNWALTSNNSEYQVAGHGETYIAIIGKPGTDRAGNVYVSSIRRPENWVYRGGQTNLITSAAYCQALDASGRLMTRAEFTNTTSSRHLGNLYGEWGNLNAFGWGARLYWTIEQSSMTDGGYNFTVGSDTGQIHTRGFLDDTVSIACIKGIAPVPDALRGLQVTTSNPNHQPTFNLSDSFPYTGFSGGRAQFLLNSNSPQDYHWYSNQPTHWSVDYWRPQGEVALNTQGASGIYAVGKYGTNKAGLILGHTLPAPQRWFTLDKSVLNRTYNGSASFCSSIGERLPYIHELTYGTNGIYPVQGIGRLLGEWGTEAPYGRVNPIMPTPNYNMWALDSGLPMYWAYRISSITGVVSQVGDNSFAGTVCTR